MAPKKSTFLSLSAILLLLTATTATARKFIGVNPWCTKASHMRLCTRMVNGAATQAAASTAALQTSLALARRIQGMVDTVRPDINNLIQKSQDDIIKSCTDGLADDVDNIENAIAAMQTNDIGTAWAVLSASLDGRCRETLNEYRIVNSVLTRYVNLLHKEVDNCLAVILQE